MIWAEMGKFVGSKVAAAIIFLAIAAGGIWCWQNPEAVKAFGQVVKLTLIWLVIVAALPWSSYLFMQPLLAFQSKLQSARAAAMVSVTMIGTYWLIDVLLAFYLAGWGFSGTLTWLVVLLGLAAAGAYTFVICESLARQAEA